MNKSGVGAVLWWLGWIGLTLLSFFVSCFFWTWTIAARVGPMNQPGVPILWVAAVFGSWMALLVPLIIVMYQKVDKAYEDARIARETKSYEKAKDDFKFKSIYVEESKRRLRDDLAKKIKTFPEAIRRGHLVNATLDDGRRIENIFVKDKREVLGIYGAGGLSFAVSQIRDVEPADLEKLAHFEVQDWLRLDGAEKP